ncbi:Hypothetical protein ETEE_2334 [Edwardsiella anguillarum ET080813]|uniref:Uncharacterized protein n=1 Tax=Edwardsiella anguillarum ET080813 TaxID=667120 RepID=A0A076LLJ7_9GAMM|nr:Hypothetical protein ETEE_2334 [Edwardsiella anguillarum ET080813]
MLWQNVSAIAAKRQNLSSGRGWGNGTENCQRTLARRD